MDCTTSYLKINRVGPFLRQLKYQCMVEGLFSYRSCDTLGVLPPTIYHTLSSWWSWCYIKYKPDLPCHAMWSMVWATWSEIKIGGKNCLENTGQHMQTSRGPAPPMGARMADLCSQWGGGKYWGRLVCCRIRVDMGQGWIGAFPWVFNLGINIFL